MGGGVAKQSIFCCMIARMPLGVAISPKKELTHAHTDAACWTQSPNTTFFHCCKINNSNPVSSWMRNTHEKQFPHPSWRQSPVHNLRWWIIFSLLLLSCSMQQLQQQLANLSVAQKEEEKRREEKRGEERRREHRPDLVAPSFSSFCVAKFLGVLAPLVSCVSLLFSISLLLWVLGDGWVQNNPEEFCLLSLYFRSFPAYCWVSWRIQNPKSDLLSPAFWTLFESLSYFAAKVVFDSSLSFLGIFSGNGGKGARGGNGVTMGASWVYLFLSLDAVIVTLGLRSS